MHKHILHFRILFFRKKNPRFSPSPAFNFPPLESSEIVEIEMLSFVLYLQSEDMKSRLALKS